MADFRGQLERTRQLAPIPALPLERIFRLRDVRRRRQRVGAGLVAVAIMLIAALAAVGVFHGDRRPVVQPPGQGTIDVFGFGMTDYGMNAIRTMSPDGTFSTVVASCPRSCGLIRGAAWSRDGTQLAYTTTTFGCGRGCHHPYARNDGVHILNVATGVDHLIVKVPHDWSPDHAFGTIAWSPDGAELVYDTGWDHGAELNVVNTDGTDPRVLLSVRGSTPLDQPSWSPDGSRIACGRQGRIFTLTPDGSKPVYLIDGEAPTWSPDGSTIAYYLENVRDGIDAIGEIAPDGTNQRILAEIPRRYSLGVDIEWSPNGAQLAAMVDNSIYVIDRDLGNRHLLARVPIRTIDSPPAVMGLTWQPIPPDEP